MDKHSTTVYSVWEVCSSCGGSGFGLSMVGIQECYYCKGNCYTRIRDDRGRFAKGAPWAEVDATGQILYYY